MTMRIGETGRIGEMATMAGSKKKKSKMQTRAKSTPKRAAPKKSRKKKLTKATSKPSSAKKVAPKNVLSKKAPIGKSTAKRAPLKTRKAPAPRQAPAPPTAPAAPPKTFVEKVRACDAGTGVWFITAGSVEHAAIQKRGIDGAVVIRTDAGVTDVVPVGNLFETADEARAARYR